MTSLRIALCCLLVSMSTFSQASEPTPDEAKFFEMKVRPLLAEHCWKCHGEEASKGGLRLDSLAHVMNGGESGGAITVGNVDESLLIQAVRYESYEMPPSKKLSDDQIQILETWVKMGAPWPGADASKMQSRKPGEFSDEDKKWWAIQPLKPVEPPKTAGSNWGRNPIDQFVLASMTPKSLTPAPDAERPALIRRVYFDLIGLPPSPEEVDAFVFDQSADAYEKVVDRLLASPEYGKRWARHWLDLVRYADSDGYRIDHYRPNAWRYRDYVIKSLNEDKPYDRFVQEQLAGDELFPDTPEAMIATGFLTHGIYEYNSRDAEGQWDIMLNEITDATGDVFLGMGMQCARCHDHKFDPILQKDYYRLRSFFAPIDIRTAEVVATKAEIAAHKESLKSWEEKTQAIRDELDAIEKPFKDRAINKAISIFPEYIQKVVHKPESEKSTYDKQITALVWRQVEFEFTRLPFKGEEKEKVFALRKKLTEFDKEKPADLPIAQVCCDMDGGAPTTLVPKKKLEVQPGFPSLIDPSDVAIPAISSDRPTTGRRAVLAKWITSPDNALTTRVIVNRIWQYHFGRGLAPNASDLGMLGGPPSHPELLDWLTQQFIDGGWKMKPLHRMIVLSSTYRQSTEHPKLDEYQTIDPRNTWYWRADTRRLDAEQIRDAILAVIGELETTSGGPGVEPDRPRRSIYTRMMRNAPDQLLDAFDLPLFFASNSSRLNTTSPIQSLLLINSQSMLRYSSQLASRLKKQQSTNQKDDIETVRQLWRVVYGREPSNVEGTAALDFLAHQRKVLSEKTEQAISTGLKTGKLPYRDGTSIVITPGDKSRLSVVPSPRMDTKDMTLEAFFQIRSVYPSGDVRTIAGRWNSDSKSPGWMVGITGQGSRRKPQTIVLIMVGKDYAGNLVEQVIFSDHHIDLNKPYYLAMSVKMATAAPGTVTFSLKDISNDDEQMQSVTMEHKIASGYENSLPFVVGGRANKGAAHQFDGLIDDVRLSDRALSMGELFYTQETELPSTVGHWRFEAEPGLLKDSSRYGQDISAEMSSQDAVLAKQTALADLCHVLLNSSEFLYVH
jgi:hypothetical protein